jgi:hypothetical protein
VGSDPTCKGSPATTADCDEGKRLFNLLNDYFANVGEERCPATGDIPEYTP